MSLRDAIDNFYERLVVDAIEATREESDTADYLTDVMCVALNRLPTRYYRHSIDMMFYLGDEREVPGRRKGSQGIRQGTSAGVDRWAPQASFRLAIALFSRSASSVSAFLPVPPRHQAASSFSTSCI